MSGWSASIETISAPWQLLAGHDGGAAQFAFDTRCLPESSSSGNA